MASFESRTDARRKAFKKAGDSEDARRKREDEAVMIRKAKKDEQLQQKRQMVDHTVGGNDENAGPSNNASNGGNAQAKLGMQQMLGQLLQPGVSSEDRLALTTDIRKRLSAAHEPPTQEAVDAGVIPPMVEFLKQQEDAKLQFEAAWVLTNIASGESHQTLAVVQAGAVQPFVQLLSNPSMDTREQAVWALANIMGDCAELRNHVLEFDPITPILALIVESEQKQMTSMLRNATWALGNVFRGKPSPDLAKVGVAIPYLAQLVHHGDVDVKADTLWAFSYLSDGGSDRIDAYLQSGSLPHVVQLLASDDDRVVQPALRAVGNVATGSDVHTDAVVQCGVLQYMPSLLDRAKKVIRKEALWLLSNVTAGTRVQIQQVLEAGFLPRVLELAQEGDWAIRKEALWVVANAAVGGSPEQLFHMSRLGAVQCLVQALGSSGHDAGAICSVLDALKAFLLAGETEVEQTGGPNKICAIVEEADGLEKLENLQNDANQDVYDKSVSILTQFFEVDENADEDEAIESGFDFS